MDARRLKWYLVSGVCLLLAVGCLKYLFLWTGGVFLGFIPVGACIVGVWAAQWFYRERVGRGVAGWGELLLNGVLLALVCAFILGVLDYVYYLAKPAALRESVEWVIAHLQKEGIEETVIVQTREHLTSLLKPWMLAGVTFCTYLFFGGFFAVVGAALWHRSPDEWSNSHDTWDK